MKIYFDTCALNRLNDDLSQPRIRRESDAVVQLLDLATDNKVQWVGSTVLRAEIDRNPDSIRRADTLKLLQIASEMRSADAAALAQSTLLVQSGIGPMDALHLAIAQQAGAEIPHHNGRSFSQCSWPLGLQRSYGGHQSCTLAATEISMASSATIAVNEMTDEEFERRTLDLIQREFGMKGVIRFIRGYRSGRGDYTAERHQWLGHLTVEDIARDMGIELPK